MNSPQKEAAKNLLNLGL